MKREISPPAKKNLVLYRVVIVLLVVLLSALVLVLAAGSIFALVRPPDSAPLLRFGGAGGSVIKTRPIDGTTAVFSGLGAFRIPIAAEPPAILILTISFPYPAGDRAFTEELASRIGEFRSIATGYFSALPAEKVINLDEDAAKADILRRYNAILRLGRIETLYFGDLMIID